MTAKPSEADLRDGDWGDQSLPEDSAIAEAFPTRSGRHDLYAESMRLVGAKRSKGALVTLVNWLLHRAEAAEKREPAQAEGDAFEHQHDQSMGPSHRSGECFVPMGGWTGRRCRVCQRWTWGGPTACASCVAAEAAVKRAAELEAALRVASAPRPSITAAFMRGLEERKRAPAAELAEANEKVAAFTRIAEKNQAELAALRATLADAVTTTGDAMARAENAEAALANLRDRHGSCGLICGHLGECGPVHRPGKDL